MSGSMPPTRRGRRASARFGELLLDLALDLKSARRQVVVLGLFQEGIETAAVVDRLERIGRDTQLHRAAKRIGNRADVAEVRQEPALRFTVRVAHLVAGLRALTGQFA